MVAQNFALWISNEMLNVWQYIDLNNFSYPVVGVQKIYIHRKSTILSPFALRFEEFSLQNKLKLGKIFSPVGVQDLPKSSTCKWSPFTNAYLWICVFIEGGLGGVKTGCQRLNSGGAANQEELNCSCCHSQPTVMKLGQQTEHSMISLHPDNWRWLKAAVLRPDQTVGFQFWLACVSGTALSYEAHQHWQGDSSALMADGSNSTFDSFFFFFNLFLFYFCPKKFFFLMKH